MADDAILQVRQELAGTDLETDVLALATRESFAVELAEELGAFSFID